MDYVTRRHASGQRVSLLLLSMSTVSCLVDSREETGTVGHHHADCTDVRHPILFLLLLFLVMLTSQSNQLPCPDAAT